MNIDPHDLRLLVGLAYDQSMYFDNYDVFRKMCCSMISKESKEIAVALIGRWPAEPAVVATKIKEWIEFPTETYPMEVVREVESLVDQANRLLKDSPFKVVLSTKE